MHFVFLLFLHRDPLYMLQDLLQDIFLYPMYYC
nr:MAG TPA: hypothetical protein [Caudoviricetes sp.]